MKQILLILAAMLLAGCGTLYKITPLNDALPSEIVDERNYEVGKVKTANVGASMITRRKYILDRWVAYKTSPDKNCAFDVYNHPGVELPHEEGLIVNFKKGDLIQLGGHITLENRKYLLLHIAVGDSLPNAKYNMATYALYDPETHQIYPKAAVNARSGIAVWGRCAINPIGTKFEKLVREEVRMNTRIAKLRETYINYDITYNGSSNDQINMVYREYDKKDRARTAFFQNLTYQVKDGKARIQFRDIAMDVQTVGNQSITFVVTEDDSTVKK